MSREIKMELTNMEVKDYNFGIVKEQERRVMSKEKKKNLIRISGGEY